MAMKNSNFAVFILTHGRADNVITYHTLRRSGYTGKIYLIIDNEDKTAEKYRELYGEDVIMFDKKSVADTTDEGDNFDDRRTITHARNACFEIAKKVGVTYFIQLDDDYGQFKFRINNKNKYPSDRYLIKTQLDNIFDLLLDFYKSTNFLSIAMSQGGDWIGGSESSFTKYPMKRKCMNSFICSTERPFKFVGRMNEDVNTYTTLGGRGKLLATIPFIALDQMQTQSNAGGITEMYKDYGTFVKSFYTVMYSPSCTKIAMMGNKNRRLHHSINWDNAVPVILSEQHRKLN